MYTYVCDPRCIPDRRITIPEESDIVKAAANLVTHTKNKPHRKLTMSSEAKDQFCMQHECVHADAPSSQCHCYASVDNAHRSVCIIYV